MSVIAPVLGAVVMIAFGVAIFVCFDMLANRYSPNRRRCAECGHRRNEHGWSPANGWWCSEYRVAWDDAPDGLSSLMRKTYCECSDYRPEPKA